MAYRHHKGHQHEAHRHSNYEHNFSQIPKANIPRSAFNRSHCHKTAFNSGDLIPFFVDEVLPGDTFAAKVHLFARLTTPLVPLMDNLYMDTFYFFVPNRLLWENWQRFNGEQNNPGDSTDYLIPQVTFEHNTHTGDIADFMGIPPFNSDINPNVNALHFRAYNLIYNQWFRDQNLIASLPVPLDDGPDDYDSNYAIQKRARYHDYFTSCLPWPQKGPSVDLPLGDSAPVVGDGFAMGFADDPHITADQFGLSTTDYLTISPEAADQIVGTPIVPTSPSYSLAVGLHQDGTKSHVFADLTQTSAATINALREAFQLQRMYERDARGGTRYTEIIRSHFGVISPDARLQRPEYLGGSSTKINVHPVAKTSSASTDESPQGFLAAFGVANDSHGGFRRSFTEHGVILGIVNVRGDHTYQQGMERMWNRQTRFDFYWPALSHLGEQAVLNQEIFISGTDADTGVFGYQERWAEYRYKPSRISGILRSTDTFGTPLDMWHLGSKFATLPVLNQEFIEDDTRANLDRCLAVESADDTPQIIFDSFIDLKCARPMPVYSVPGLIDHF